MQKDAIVVAFALTTVVFVIGIFIGFWLDSARVEDVSKNLLILDNQGSDARLQNIYYQMFGSSSSFCEAALEQNLKFNEQIYQTGIQLDRTEMANRFDPNIRQEKTRYALLQTQFWFNAISIKNKCNANYSTMVYFYKNLNNSDVSDKQKVQSTINLEMKEKCGPNLMLVVLPIDLNITTINAIKQSYGINETPSLLINENTVLRGLTPRTEIEKYIKCE
ncbi:MAG: hypothetical protein NT120_03820 [Candidatus Aenigmarchaeota archaeon]|nr:hypothetical protein [Candidatus Aenigmarchaeota archaeon]